MAITTLDQLVASMLPQEVFSKAAFTGEAVGILHSSWYLAGTPGSGPAPSSGLSGALRVAPLAGQVPFPGAAAGKNIYLARLEAVQGANIGGMTLCDRIWTNSGIAPAATTAQTVNSAAWDRDNTFDGVFTGTGVQVALEVSTATTNTGVVTATINYTNDVGTAGRTATASIPATSVVGTFVPFNLMSGDLGVRSIQTVQLSATLGNGAVVHLVAYRQIVAVGTPQTNVIVREDGLSLGLPRLHDSSVPWFIYRLTGTAAGVSDIGVTWAQG